MRQLSAIAILLIVMSAPAYGSGQGDICFYLNGGVDQAFIGDTNTLEIWIANDDTLIGMSPSFEITFATAFSWNDDYSNTGDPDDPYVQEHGRAVDAWWVLNVTTYSWDEVSPEYLLLSGVAVGETGLPPGPSELCYSLQFEIPADAPETPAAICIEPYVVPPPAAWGFYDSGGGYPPDFCGQEILSEVNPVADPVCFDVVQPICGDADASGFVNVTDCVYLLVYIFGGGPEPVPYLAGDVDCNGFVNVTDAVYIRSYIFSGGPEPCAWCP